VNRLRFVLWAQKRYEKAEIMLREVLKSRIEVLGVKDKDSLDTMVLMGNVRFDMG
jgi:hypothetical protein